MQASILRVHDNADIIVFRYYCLALFTIPTLSNSVFPFNDNIEYCPIDRYNFIDFVTKQMHKNWQGKFAKTDKFAQQSHFAIQKLCHLYLLINFILLTVPL